MKKNISIEKKIDFSSMIGEVSAISLEHNLKFISNDEIAGDLVVCGRYKATAASQIEEEFNEKIPVSISLMEKVDVETAKVDIVDFYYDVLDNASLNCNIELLVDALELIDDLDDDVREAKVSEEDRECDGDPVDTKEIEIPKIEKTDIQDSNIIENIEINNNINANVDTNIDINAGERKDDTINNSKKSEIDVESENVEVTEEAKESESEEECENLFFNFDSSKETYGTFVVYIVRQNETINTIIEKYNTTVEEIEKYNDIKDISIGSKLIIPLLNEKD